VRFDDGSTLTHAQLMTLATTATSGNDSFVGDELANTLSGAAGNDTLQGAMATTRSPAAAVATC
jgi:hypothetical protein